jgi:hypothetical protein
MRFAIYLLLLLALLMSAMYGYAQSSPQAWMEPEHPTDHDHISIYCKAPGAYDVRFNVCSDNGTLCYMLMNQTKVDSETWKIDVYGTLKAGTHAHYEVTVIYQNGTTGNESEKHLGPVHFTVESSTPFIGPAVFIITLTISAIAWGYMRRES